MQRRQGWRRGIWWMAMLTGVVVLACAGEIDLIEIEHAEELTIPAPLPGEPLDNVDVPAGEGFDPLDSPELEQYGGAAAAVADVTLVEASLAVVDGAPNLDWLDFIAFYLEEPGGEMKLLAQAEEIPPNSQWVQLVVHDDVDLTDYIGEGNLLPVVRVTGVVPDVETKVEISFVMSMGVSVADTCAQIFGTE
jgi:hypothetical protein